MSVCPFRSEHSGNAVIISSITPIENKTQTVMYVNGNYKMVKTNVTLRVTFFPDWKLRRCTPMAR